MNHYKDYTQHYLAVDIIIFGFDKEKLKLLLIKRNFEPCKGQWSLMGGFVGENESLDQAAERVLFELTGLKEIYLEQLLSYGDPKRDSAGRVISVSYFALIDSVKFEEEVSSEYTAKWFDMNELPELIFDHEQMVEKALNRLRRKTKTQPVGLKLLPDKFTLPQLMTLYEAILQQSFDKRNFRKKILSFGVLNKLDEKDKTNSKKGAFFYTFDKEKYDELIQNGYGFEL